MFSRLRGKSMALVFGKPYSSTELIIETLALSIMSPTVFEKFLIEASFYPVNP
jgi:hypothetical protein